MNVLFGLGMIVLAGGVAALCIGMFRENDRLLIAGASTLVGVLVLAAVGFGLALIFGLNTGPTIVENACYRAVGTNTTVIIPVGKVFIPTTTRGVSLVEIRCP